MFGINTAALAGIAAGIVALVLAALGISRNSGVNSQKAKQAVQSAKAAEDRKTIDAKVAGQTAANNDADISRWVKPS